MNIDTAKSLLHQYSVVLYRAYRNKQHEVFNSDQDRLEHLVWMGVKAQEFTDEGKTMRWLGYVQGVLHTLCFYTLDQLKEHSRSGHV